MKKILIFALLIFVLSSCVHVGNVSEQESNESSLQENESFADVSQEQSFAPSEESSFEETSQNIEASVPETSSEASVPEESVPEESVPEEPVAPPSADTETSEDQPRPSDEKLRGVWISQYDISSVWYNANGQNTKASFTDSVDKICKELADNGYNAVFLQLRPFGDSFYPSEYYPPSRYAVGAYGNEFDYDGLEIFIESAHKQGLELHAWINPFRLMTPAEIELVSDDYVLKQYYNDGGLTLFNNRYYILPSDTQGCEIILNGIREILVNYDVDGIHFDDYFYPTKEPSFDNEAFSESGHTDLYNWRRENVTDFVKKVYDLVKEIDTNCIFGISPSGNVSYTYNTCCTDIYLWGSTEGYVDYLMPQIYFGYKHDTAPFSEILSDWQGIVTCEQVDLFVGLAAYKQGEEDLNAGTAKNEWITDTDMLWRQADECIERCGGYVMFSLRYI